MRGLHPVSLGLPVLLPITAGSPKRLPQTRSQRALQHYHTVFIAFCLADDDDVAVKVHIFDAQAQPLHQPHARSVKQLRQQAHVMVQKLEQGAHLLFGQHAGNAALLRRAVDTVQPRQVNAQHLPVQKQNGTERLVVVEAETLRSLASMFSNASTSAAPMSRGCRIWPMRPCHRTKNRTQCR